MIKTFLQNIATELSVTNTFFTATPDELNLLLDKVEQSAEPVVAFVPPASVQITKRQSYNITGVYSVQLLFLKFIKESSLDETTVDKYTIIEAMRALAIEFMTKVQNSEAYRKTGSNTQIDGTINDIMEVAADSYLCGVSLNIAPNLLLDWDFCLSQLGELIVLESGQAILID